MTCCALCSHPDGLCSCILQYLMQVKIALEAHARQLGTTLADVMKGVGWQSRRSLGAYIAAPSQRFTASRRMSLLRAAGVSGPELVPGSESNPVSPTGSQASSATSDVAPVATLVDVAVGGFSLHTEGAVTDTGDPPSIGACGLTEAEIERHAAAVRAPEPPLLVRPA